jgi:hypothetical protein
MLVTILTEISGIFRREGCALGLGYGNISAQGPNRIGVSPYSLHLKTEIEPVSETLIYLKTRTMDKVQVNNIKHSSTGVCNETNTEQKSKNAAVGLLAYLKMLYQLWKL